MDHELAEALAGLASRVNNLAILHTGDDSRRLLAQQDQLSKLALAAITKELNAEQASYQAALQGLRDAITYIGNADTQLSSVAKGIKLVAKAITLATKALAAV